MPSNPMRRLPAKLFAATVLWLATAPLTLLLGVAFAPIASMYTLLPLFAIFAPALLGTLLPRRRLLCGMFLLAGLIALAAWIVPTIATANIGAWTMPVICAVLLALMLRATASPSGEEWPSQAMMFCALLHIVAFVLLRVDAFAPARTVFLWISPLYMLALLLVINERTLQNGVALRKDSRPPGRIIARNRAMILGFAGIVLFVSQFQRVRAAFYVLLGYIGAAVGWVLSLLSMLYPTSEGNGGGGGGPADMGLPLPEGQPGWLALLLEKILQYAVFIALAAAAIVVAYFLGKKLLRLLQKLRARWTQYAASLNANYVDEAESVFDWGEMKNAAQDKLRDAWTRVTRRKVRWGELDNRARIRHAYAELLRKHPDLPPARTAHTLLTAGDLKTPRADATKLATSYDTARYSDHPLTDEEAENARRAIE